MSEQQLFLGKQNQNIQSIAKQKKTNRKNGDAEYIKKIINALKGNVILLCGKPYIGKTSFVVSLCGFASRVLGMKTLYFANDINLIDTSFYKQEVKPVLGDKVDVVFPAPLKILAKKPDLLPSYFLKNAIEKLSDISAGKYHIIVIDSITQLKEGLLMGKVSEKMEKKFSGDNVPTVKELKSMMLDMSDSLLLSRLNSIIAVSYALATHQYNMIYIIITHTISQKDPDPMFGSETPSFSSQALRNSEIVLKMYMASSGRRYIKPMVHRYAFSEFPFEYIDADRVIGYVRKII